MSQLEKFTNGLSLQSLEERAAALSAARSLPMPPRDNEEWRKNDAAAFPWDLLDSTRETAESHVSLAVRDGLTPDALLATVSEAEMFSKLLVSNAAEVDAKFLACHRAFNSRPVCLRVPANMHGVVIDLAHTFSESGLAAPATLIIVESGAEVVVHDRWIVNHERAALIGRTEIVVKQGARLHYVQDEQTPELSSIYRSGRIQVERDGYVNWCAFTTGGRWHVSKLRLDLLGVNTEAHLYGLFGGYGAARAEHRTHQHHNTPKGYSNLLFKTLMAGGAHSIYQGIITVPQHAQKTDAYQTCRNLMLDPGTHAEAIPKLEIIADDVKCSHGASIGTLNKEQMFYLQSRGLTHRQALTAIAMGFAEEVISKIPAEFDDVQQNWRDRVARAVGLAKG